MLHNPEYIFDDEAIPFGSSWYARNGRRAASNNRIKISFVLDTYKYCRQADII